MEWMGVAMVRWVAMGGGQLDPVGENFLRFWIIWKKTLEIG